tara:strand:+ start:6917 stop:7477 length:561 start_codon:yes stop_codon:yes gene_type:complete
MTSNVKETPINLFIKQTDIDNNVLNKDDSSTAYIIYQNNIIQGKYHKLISEFNELRNEKDTLEEDNDRLEKTKTCLQGHVKNEFIKATCYKDLLTNTSEILNEQMKMFLVCNLMSIFYMIIPFMNFTINYSLAMILTIVSIHSSIIINTYNKINLLKTDEKIQKTEQDIDEIEKSSILIEELVDNF